jgi:glutamate 5-kinase
MSKIGLSTRPKDTPSKQACAAVGQCELMDIYDKLFDAYGIKIGQILLTKYVIDTPRKNNVLNTINKLIEFGVIPIVNENDTVAIDELELDFGENDSLAAFVAIMSKSDLLVIMSDIDGLFDGNPNDNPNAKLIPFIEDISDEIRGAAGGAGSMLGSGGMATKIKAAEIVTEAGIDMAIINGKDPENLYKLFDGEEIGSIFVHKS